MSFTRHGLLLIANFTKSPVTVFYVVPCTMYIFNALIWVVGVSNSQRYRTRGLFSSHQLMQASRWRESSNSSSHGRSNTCHTVNFFFLWKRLRKKENLGFFLQQHTCSTTLLLQIKLFEMHDTKNNFVFIPPVPFSFSQDHNFPRHLDLPV